MRLPDTFRRLKARFYEGPDWLEVPDVVDFKSYRSPGLMLLLWASALYDRVFSTPGRLLAALLVAIAMYSTILPRNNVAMLLFALLSLFALDFAGSWLFRPRLEILREAPERVRSGASFKVRYLLRNRRRLPAWDLTLDAELVSRHFKRDGDTAKAMHVGGGGEARAEASYTALKRGKATLTRPLAESSFPFNLFKRSCRSGQAQPLTVHPCYSPLESLRMPGGPRLQKLGLTALSNIGESMEFHGCREFRTGDDPRKIHWLGSARSGELVVKEFQEERLNRVALVLDTYVPRPQGLMGLLKTGSKPFSEDFEAAVSLTAAIAEHLARGEFVIDLFAAGTTSYHFQGGRSLAHLDDLLDILSCVDPVEEEPFERLEGELLDEISAIGAVIIVLMRGDRKAERLCETLRDCGADVRAILVSERRGPDWLETAAPSDIRAGRVSSL